MSCTSPLIRAETYEAYTNQKGGKSYKAEWLPRTLMDECGNLRTLRRRFNHKYRKIDLVGCGQCIDCQLNYSRDRATQMMLHKQYGYHEVFDENNNPLDKGHAYPDGTCWFLTVTYADEYLKTFQTLDTETGEKFEGISLSVEDHQKFIKRLRKKYPQIKIQFVCAGEYGSQTLRPHYHYIIYGLPLPQETFVKRGLNGLNQPIWSCDELTDIWGMGHVTIGRVDWRSAAYVARYTLKKAFKKDKDYYYAQGMHPEFIIWSNGIGKEYYFESKDKIYTTDEVMIPGKMVKPPKSYDRYLKESDPELYNKIKAKREQAAQFAETQWQTDLTPEERRKMQEARMKQVIKDIRTEV